MRPLIALAATAAFLFSVDATSNSASAKTYSVKYLGSKALAGTCKRGGGKFHQSTAISHSCTYKNGNVRDCSSKSKTCVVVTPDKARVQQATGVGGVPAGGAAVDGGPRSPSGPSIARMGGGSGGGLGFKCGEKETHSLHLHGSENRDRLREYVEKLHRAGNVLALPSAGWLQLRLSAEA